MTELCADHLFRCVRRDQHLIVELLQPHRVLSTAVVGGGMREDLTHLMNHQFCEGVGDADACNRLGELGHDGYHRQLCEKLSLAADTSIAMSTAANMACAASATASYKELSVTCIATAGVSSNATRAGDPTRWHETADGSEAADGYRGTIVHLVMVNQPCSAGCLTKAATIITEAKACCLLDWRIPSRQSHKLATGTGTDQFALAAPLVTDATWERRWAGTHHRFGELLAEATYTATRRALEQQNGLSSTVQRSVLVALGRHGIDEDKLTAQAATLLDTQTNELFAKNFIALIHDPRSVACAYHMANVCDLVDAGVLPSETKWESLHDQAGMLACALGWADNALATFKEQIRSCTDLNELVGTAMAQGFAQRWRQTN